MPVKWSSIAAWILVLFWIEIFPFTGSLDALNGIDFMMIFILALSFQSDNWTPGITALCAGILMDAFSPVPIHTPVFIGIFYGTRLLRRSFYYPGSPFHVSACWFLLFGAQWALLSAGAGFHFPSASQAAYLLKWSLTDFSLFVIMILFFGRKRQAVVLKMR